MFFLLSASLFLSVWWWPWNPVDSWKLLDPIVILWFIRSVLLYFPLLVMCNLYSYLSNILVRPFLVCVYNFWVVPNHYNHVYCAFIMCAYV